MNVEELIEYYSNEYEVDVRLAKRIAWCESNYIPTAQSPISSAGGTFQFLDSTWISTLDRMGINYDPKNALERKFEPVTGVKAGTWLLSQDGVVHWEASRFCWDNYLVYNK